MKGYRYIAVLFCLSLVACGPKVIFEDTINFENDIWSYENIFKTTFDIGDMDQQYNLVAVLKHTDEYPFENLYLKIHTRFPNSEEVSDQISIPMADKYGRWLGNCGSTQCDLEIMLQEKIKFKESGTHHIEFEQFTRSESIKGIPGLSFKIEIAQ